MKPFQLKDKHLKYIKQKISAMSHEQMLRYMVDVQIDSQCSKISQFRQFIELAIIYELSKAFNLSELELKMQEAFEIRRFGKTIKEINSK